MPTINDQGDGAVTDMPAVTLWQPWPSLIAEGIKTIETRSWKAPERLIGRRIAIHAAKKRPEDNWPDLPFPPWTMWADEFDDRWLQWYEDGSPGGEYRSWPMPLGAVVATARLDACVPMVPSMPAQSEWREPWQVLALEPWPTLVTWRGYGSAEIIRTYADQIPFGDFAPGRWAWMLADIEKFPEPIPASGRQGVWRWTPPGSGSRERHADPSENGSSGQDT